MMASNHTKRNRLFSPAVMAVVLLLWVAACTTASAQLNSLSTNTEKRETRNGNKQYEKGNFADAEASYKKALDKQNNMPQATFNLGDAVYAQKRYDEAAKLFLLSAQTNPDKSVKAKAYHNLGNVFLQQQKWQEAANAYKEALKNNPADADTKYNLAYANSMLKKQQEGQDQNKDKKDQKENKDQKKDQENKDQNKQDQNKDQQNKDQQSENKDNKDKQQGKQQPQPKLSKEEAEKMLQALQGEEQKTNQKMQQKQIKVVPVKIEKDW